MLDLAIIGGGPAALSAAIYAARAGLKVKLFEKADFGGILPTIPNLENYPGFMGEGKILARQMREQATQAGASLEYGECTDLTLATPDITNDSPAQGQAQARLSARSSEQGQPQPHNPITLPNNFLLTVDNEPILARSVLIASGSEPKKLSFDLNIPISYCALCDGALARDKRVVVVGGANSAVQEALYLAGLAKEITIISHSPLKADQELLDRLPEISHLKVIENVEPTSDFLNQFDHCFVYIGKTPAVKYLDQLAQQYALLSRDGYVLADQNNAKYPHQTVIEGLFVAGDLRYGATRQVVTAAADGAEAAIEITKWLR